MTQLKQQIEDYLNKKKLEEVIEVCQQALQKNSNDLIAYHGLGVALQLKGQLEEAKQWYFKILEQQPNLAEVHVNLGCLYAQNKQQEKAIESYETALRLQPNLVQAHRNLAKLLYEVGQPEQATEHEYQALQLSHDAGTAQQWFNLGTQLWQQQKLEEAAVCYQQAINKKPDFFEACYNLAKSLTQLQDWEKAEEIYRQAIKLNPKFERAYIGLGNVLVEKEQWDEAIALYQKAIECNPNYSWTYHHLGDALLNKKSWEAATIEYQKAIKINPSNALSYLKLGDALQKQGNLEAATVAYQKVIELEPRAFWAYQNLGKILYYQGKSLSKPQKYKDAIAAYSKAIQLNPSLGAAYYNLGLSLWQMQQWEDAVAAYIQAIKLQPDEMIFIHQLGDLLRNQPKLSLEATLKSYLRLSSDESHTDSEVQNHLSLSLIQLGQKLADSHYYQAAIFLYQLSLQINPEQKEAPQKVENALKLQQEMELKIQQAEEMAKKHPKSFQGYRDLGALLIQTNYWSQSIDAYLKALKLKPGLGDWYYEKELWNLAKHQKKLDCIVEIYRETLKQHPSLVNCHVNLGKALSLQDKVTEAIACYREAGRQITLTKCKRLQNQSNPKLSFVESPDFIIIGAQKCGTTSLYHYLAQHPKILPSIIKEINFWSREFHHGLEWYLAQFPPSPKKQKLLTGEATPGYLDYTKVPERLFQTFPKMKLIVLLRNPVNRAISHYYHWIRDGWESRPLQEVIDVEIQQLEQQNYNYWNKHNGYISRGIYVKFLKKWMSIFPKEQFLIIKSEDFYDNPATTLSQVYHFLEIPNRKIEDYKPYNSGNYSSIDPAIIQTLQNYFKPYNHELEDFLGMKFNWD
jgi:tetratricopeptide (TPR) repeat protein